MMRFRTSLFLALAVLSATATVSAAQAARPPQTPPPDLTTLDIEQLMQLEVVFAASKRNQNPREVASVVSVVTAAEIRQHGYRTLADILRSLPSFFVSYDRNYSYVGVRGFSQPGDYSSRVLLLLNGLRTNDNIYDQAAVGEEFVVDVDLIDRVEVVRGPSAAIYGSSAFFAVINVVTKRGGAVHGAEIAGSGASFGTYAGRASYGTTFGNGVEVLASASIGDGAGASRLYFREFDDPSTNGGVAENADGESFRKLFMSVAKGRFSFEASHVSRDKGVPTGSFETVFNDSRNRTTDQVTLASLTYDRPFAKGSASARLHSGRYHYYGEYAYDATRPNQDLAYGEWWGIDLDATRSLSTRNLLTIGLEYRDNYRQDQKNYTPEPYAMVVNDYHQSQRLGVFAQNELTLFKPLILYTGVRQDWYDTFGAATSPRLGLIYNPGDATTLKLMLGRAFRVPNEYEFHYGGGSIYKVNPFLGPERIETLELAAERRIGNGVRVTASAFRNQISDLITLQRDPADDLLVFENVGTIDSDGLELGLAWNRGRGVTGALNVTWQETSDHATGVELTNSPQRMAKLQLAVPLVKEQLSAGIDAHYLSGRGTLAGAEAKEYVVTNLTVLAPRLFHRVETSATVYNVFATKYGNPGSEEHVQDIIQQDGRSFRVKATLRF